MGIVAAAVVVTEPFEKLYHWTWPSTKQMLEPPLCQDAVRSELKVPQITVYRKEL